MCGEKSKSTAGLSRSKSSWSLKPVEAASSCQTVFGERKTCSGENLLNINKIYFFLNWLPRPPSSSPVLPRPSSPVLPSGRTCFVSRCSDGRLWMDKVCRTLLFAHPICHLPACGTLRHRRPLPFFTNKDPPHPSHLPSPPPGGREADILKEFIRSELKRIWLIRRSVGVEECHLFTEWTSADGLKRLSGPTLPPAAWC